MKESPFDKALSDRMKKLLEEHEEPYQQGEWERFSAIYFTKNKSKRKYTLLWWVSGVAASLALLFYSLPFTTETTSFEQDSVISDSSTPSSELIENPNGLNFSESQNFNQELSKAENSINPSPKNSPNSTPHYAGITLGKKLDSSDQDLELNLLAENRNLLDSLQNVSPQEIIEQNQLITSQETSFDEKKFNSEKVAEKILQQWLTEGTLPVLERPLNSKQGIKFGVLLSPQAISQSTEAVNLGAGLISQFSFSKRLKLDVGVALGRQQMNASPVPRSRLLNSQIDEAFTKDVLMSNVIGESVRLRFNHVEIPLNLRYNVRQTKNADWYLISGISSVLYYNQKSETSFSSVVFGQSSLYGNSSQIQVYKQTLTPQSVSENSIDSGALFNISFGYEYHLKKGSSLSFEPFYKFSVGEQTFTNETFGIGGMNVRMNFQFKNQK
jgi:hypothetical protein